MRRLQHGFTLIELMIVVAIVGILAAIALPSYQDFVVRAKMSEAIAALGACKTSVAEFAATRSAFPANVTAAGCSTTVTQYVASTTVASNGAITVTSRATGASPAECALTLTPLGSATGITGWSGSTRLCASKYVPSNFR
jgi:type IV pilus assembly protein PilA